MAPRLAVTAVQQARERDGAASLFISVHFRQATQFVNFNLDTDARPSGEAARRY